MIPIISSRPDGLGTRLLSLLYGLRLAEQTGSAFSIGWPSLRDSNYSLHQALLQHESIAEIFVLDQPIMGRDDVRFVDSSVWQGRRCCMLHGAHSHLHGKSLPDIAHFCSTFDVLVYDLPLPTTVGISDPELEKHATKRNWTRLAFAQDIFDAFANFSDNARPKDSVSVHIRRGDILNMLKSAPIEFLIQQGGTSIFQRYVPTKTIQNILLTHFQSVSSVIVCSEDDNVANEIAGSLPGKVVHQSLGIFPKDSNKAALLDLMILAGSRHLVTPFKSYFSECAMTVGDCSVLNVGLDIPNLLSELLPVLDASDVQDRSARRALLLMMGYLNLWHQPHSSYRAELLARAMDADQGVVDTLIRHTRR
jgi:hypothetical protein